MSSLIVHWEHDCSFSQCLRVPETQADGPHHWLANRRAPTGETLGRRRLLAARGWAVVSVPYFDWPGGGARDKQAYMHAVRCLPTGLLMAFCLRRIQSTDMTTGPRCSSA